MFTRKKSEEIKLLKTFGDQTNNAIRVGQYFSTGVTFFDWRGEFGIDELFDELFEDDIEYLTAAIDGELETLDYLGRRSKIEPFQALARVTDSYNVSIKV